MRFSHPKARPSLSGQGCQASSKGIVPLNNQARKPRTLLVCPDEVNEFGGFDQKDDNQKPLENKLFRVFQHEGLLLNQKQTQTNYPVEIKTVSRGWVLYFLPSLLSLNEINGIAAKLDCSTAVKRIYIRIIRNFNKFSA